MTAGYRCGKGTDMEDQKCKEKKLKKKVRLLVLIDVICEVTIAFTILNEVHDHTLYECPECGVKFVPTLKDFAFANHTPKTRKLTCPNCGSKEYCEESYR